MDVSISPRTIESTSRRTRTQSTLSNRRAQSSRQGRRRQSISERAARKRPHDKASPTDSRERRPWTRSWTCLLQDIKGTGEQRRLHHTRRPVNQYCRVCVERCPLTTRHTAKCGRRQLPSESARTRPRDETTQLWECTRKPRQELEAWPDSLRLHGPRCTIAASCWATAQSGPRGEMGDVTHPSPGGCHNNTSLAATPSLFYPVR